jgi:23S rRNA pseudouridine1911/1915/1917 synthase
MGPSILHIDNHLLVVAKPAGLPIVPDSSGDESLFDQVRDWIEREYNKPGRAFLGVVHRLDRPVSGVVLFARTSKAAARMGAAFKQHRVKKTYWAISQQAPEGESGELEQWLLKDAKRNQVRAFDHEVKNSKLAQTRWRVLRSVGQGARRRVLVQLEPLTGRSHQLRVAMASLGAPLCGDLKYGASEALEDRSVALHARQLQFPHPTLGTELSLSAGLPELGIWDLARKGI